MGTLIIILIIAGVGFGVFKFIKNKKAQEAEMAKPKVRRGGTSTGGSSSSSDYYKNRTGSKY